MLKTFLAAGMVVAGLGLASCSTQDMLAKKDDADCRAKGFEVGSAPYADCRAAIDKERADTQARAFARTHVTCIPGTPGVNITTCR